MPDASPRTGRRDLLVVAALAALALVPRLWVALDQSTFGDELFTYLIVHVDGFGEVIDGIQATESTPPVFYTLAWLSQKLGDPLFFQRLPSILLATLTVPAVYALGVRTVGRHAALIAAAAFAVSPFAVFYGSEARAYATLTFFEVVAAATLLRALERGASRWWWVAVWASASGAALTHYTGIPVLAALAAWALWFRRERIRDVVLTFAAVGLSVLAWLPFAEKNVATTIVDALYPATLENIVGAPLRALFGYPVPVRLDTVPGTVPLLVLIAVAAAGAAGFALRVARDRGLRDELLLVAMLALATPAALLIWSVVGADLFAPRNLQASLPAALLLIAGGLVALPRRAAIAAAGAWIVALAVGTVVALQPDQRRPDFRGVADYIESRVGPGDAVVEVEAFPFHGPLEHTLEAHLDGDVTIHESDFDSGDAEAAARGARRVLIVMPERQLGSGRPALPVDVSGRRLIAERRFRGQSDLSVLVYDRAP